MQNVVTELHVAGALTCRQFTPPVGSITAPAVQAGAGIEASKLQQQYLAMLAGSGLVAAAAQREVVHVARGAVGKVQAFRAGLRQACVGDATVTVDLLKDGVSVLTAPLVLDNSVAAYTLVSGTLADDDLAAGDVLEVAVTVDAGTGTLGQGVFAQAVVREDAQ